MDTAKILNINEREEYGILTKAELTKLSKEELIEMIIKLDQGKRDQEDFILNISHDLRSPLSVILSILQCYKDEYLNNNKNNKLHEHMDIIKRNGYKILKLINNLIDTTKLEKNHYKLEKRNLDIINLIEWNISSIDKYAKQKDISLVFDTNVEECIMAIDAEAIDRIIMNLISNSIKFSPQDSNIYINVWKSKNEITISVKDEGIGIPKDEQNDIFNRFVQSTKNKKNEYCGSGIGLDLVRYLTKAHNGSVELRSEENNGCEFIIKLPIIKLSNATDCKSNCLNVSNKVELLEVEFSDIYL
jgi:signal transduction histidine kinase